MIKDSIKKIGLCIAPQWTKNIIEKRWIAKQLEILRRMLVKADDIEKAVDTLLGNRYFMPDQKRFEIIELLRCIKILEPKRILEIGSRRGGTMILFSHVSPSDSQLLSIDIGFTDSQMEAYSRIAKRSQSIKCYRGDSHASETLRYVKEWSQDRKIDFLFIDGDHTLRGVEQDFVMYSPLVRKGGIIAFHDIMPDHNARYGMQTGNDAGDVPLFWSSLKDRSFEMSEIIEDREQDGMGIGIIKW